MQVSRKNFIKSIVGQILACFCAIVCVTHVAVAGEKISQADYGRLERAYKQLSAEKYGDCLATLAPMLKKEKAPSYAFSYGSLAYAGQDRFAKAADLLGRAVLLFPENVGFYHNLGNFQMQLERYRAAVGTYRTLVKMQTGTKEGVQPSTYYHLAFALYRLEKYGEALQNIGRVGQMKKHHLMLKLYCEIALKRWSGAESTCRRIIAMGPMQSQNWHLLSQIALHRGHYPRAAASLEIAAVVGAKSQDEKKKASDGRLLGQIYRSQKTWLELAHKESGYKAARDYFLACDYGKALQHTAQMGAGMEESLLHGQILLAMGREKAALPILLGVAKQNLNYVDLDGAARNRLSLKQKRQKRDGLNAQALLLAGQSLWLKRDWVAARDTFKRLEHVPGQAALGKTLADLMQFYLDEREVDVILPELYDPPMVIEI